MKEYRKSNVISSQHDSRVLILPIFRGRYGINGDNYGPRQYGVRSARWSHLLGHKFVAARGSCGRAEAGEAGIFLSPRNRATLLINTSAQLCSVELEIIDVFPRD